MSALRRPVLLVLALLAGLAPPLVAGCSTPGCKDAVECVESCDTPAFRQCGPCPSGSVPASQCTEGGSPDAGSEAGPPDAASANGD